MKGRQAGAVSFLFQIHAHAPVTINSLMIMINDVYGLQNLCLMGIVIRLPVFPVVIVGVWTNAEPPKQPSDAKLCMIFVNKSISL